MGRRRNSRRGTVAVEFALVTLPFVMLLLFLLEIGYDLFAQEALDYAVHAAARQVEVGNAQSVTTAAAFQQQYLCPAIPALIPCSQVFVNVQVITSDFYASGSEAVPVANGKLSPGGWGFCPGKPDQLMLVQALYAGPTLLGLLFPSLTTAYGGGYVHVTISSAAFMNENFAAPASAPAGC